MQFLVTLPSNFFLDKATALVLQASAIDQPVGTLKPHTSYTRHKT
jgi:hypothetical protein